MLLLRRATVAALLTITCAVPARALPHLPEAIRNILADDVIPEGALRDAGPGERDASPADSSMAARMNRARHADVIADPDDAMFDDAKVRLGSWASGRFLRTYGTALLLMAPWDDHRTPVFLIHGINGSPRDLADVVSRFRSSRYQPVVFYYPTGMSLAAASRELGMRLREFLERHPTEGFAVVGHSMGGLVAKGMLDEFDVAREFPAWKAFVGLSCPWKGVPLAAHADRLPVHPASWEDLAPRSSFLARINTTPFPPRVGFYMFFGARSSRSIFSILGNNDGRLTVDSMMDTPLAASARDTFGFYEDHASILRAPRVFDRLQMVLDHEIGGASAGEASSPAS